ncbi:MAG: ATP-binding protein [Roseinatronobacter sp.]
MLLTGLPRPFLAMLLVGLAATGWFVAAQVTTTPSSWTVLGIAGAMAVLALLNIIVQIWLRAQRATQLAAFDSALRDDLSPCLIVEGRKGTILWRNMVAATSLPNTPLMAQLLTDFCAQPPVFLRRQHDAAAIRKVAYTKLVVNGSEQAVTVQDVGSGRFLWRFRPLPRPEPHAMPDLLSWLHVTEAGQIIAMTQEFAVKVTPQIAHLDDVFVGGAPLTPELSPVIVAHSGESALAARLSDGRGGALIVLLPPEIAPTLRADAQVALNQLPVAIAHIDPEDQIVFANIEARRLLHLSDQELPCFSDRLEGLGRPIAEWLDDIRANRAGRGTEVLRLAQHGVENFVQVSVRPMPMGPPNMLLAVLNDATELKSLEAKFTQSQKMHAIGQLAGGVAHDFNNLLTAISGHCELILMRHDRSDIDYPDLMQIQQNTNRAAALVRQLLAFSRKQTLQFETIDLQAGLGDLVHLMNRLVGEKITLSVRFADRPIAIRSDRRQFEQILVNLVVNARDAMPLGGEIVIETRLLNLPQGMIRERATLPAGEYAVIEVRDQGIGIPAANLGKLFEPFFTTKRQGEGTGLGLSTVYGIVKQMGGFIFIDSQEGLGTIVTLYFKPKDVRDVIPRTDTRAIELRGIGQKRALVLLVEDEAPVRSFAARALQLQGHRVLEADSGEAALTLLADASVQPDLFVTDVIMPGLDGPSWIAQVRDRYPLTPVVFMSGYAEDGRSAAQARTEHSVFLAKPFSLADFTCAVNTQLKSVDKAA